MPVYEQIIEAVALAVSAGELLPGDPLPSVRALASELRVNPNTAARALRELEVAGLSVPVKGVGSTVAPRARVVAARRSAAALERELDGIVEVASRLGLTLTETCDRLMRRWEHEDNAD
ncbi:MAG: GntR family transcriptional regulator [bacterium]|nr:GntR family transcriptional regulator [bacterium]